MLSALVERIPQCDFEVISADSRQVYRRFDIGTAKPDRETLERIPHHLIDIVDGYESFDVGQFVAACDELVPEIQRRGNVALISGGTAFYLQAYLFGLPEAPPSDPQIRAVLEAELAQDGLPTLRARLSDVDPVADERIAANDAYRVLRALEVYRLTGHPLSSYPVPDTVRQGIEPLVIGLYRERSDLYHRINQRVTEMMAAGLADEVAHLIESGYTGDEPGFRSIGYREFPELAGKPPWSVETLRRVEAEIARNSRRYAKRQELFFRRLPLVHWVPAHEPAAVAELIGSSRGGTADCHRDPAGYP